MCSTFQASSSALPALRRGMNEEGNRPGLDLGMLNCDMYENSGLPSLVLIVRCTGFRALMME